METIIDVLKSNSKNYPSRKALVFKSGGGGDKWESYDWKTYHKKSQILASKFLDCGLQPNQGVAMLGFNSKEWFISNMAAIMAGGVSVGIYTTNSADVCDYIIKDSNTKIIMVDTIEQLDKILSINRDTLKSLYAIICVDNQFKNSKYSKAINCFDNELVYSWKDFYSYSDGKSSGANSNKDDAITEFIQPQNCSTMIYTSGTTGLPKGVMLSHNNILWTTKAVLKIVGITKDTPERVLSYLPLSHVAAQMVDVYMPLVIAGETWFAESSDLKKGTLGNKLRECHPSIFLGVPRVWKKIKMKMEAIGAQNSKLKQKIATKAKKVGLFKVKQDESYVNDNQKPKPSLGWKIYNAMVFKKVKNVLGLDKCKIFLTGAAPMSMQTLEYFASLDIPIHNIYGMSECTGPTTISFPGNSRMGSCGRSVPGTELKIDNDTGEICTKGPHVMLGYLNKPEKTANTIDEDGWLHSGDIGKLDKDGFLYITGRIKDIIITEGGENIPPVRIENVVKSQLPVVSNCVLIGDQKHYLTMLITLRTQVDDENVPTDLLEDEVKHAFQKIGSKANTASEAAVDKKVREYIQNGINKANEKSISKAQKVQKFRILPMDFSMHGGELGPTLKLKRNVVVEKYQDVIDDMYK